MKTVTASKTASFEAFETPFNFDISKDETSKPRSSRNTKASAVIDLVAVSPENLRDNPILRGLTGGKSPIMSTAPAGTVKAVRALMEHEFLPERALLKSR